MYFKFRYLEILFLLCYRYLHALTLCIDWRDESAHNDNFNYRFFLTAGLLITIDYMKDDQLNLTDNIFQALFIMVFMQVMTWLTTRDSRTR